MGDMADFTNETGFAAACHEQDVLDRGDACEMYEEGLIDELGFLDFSNPPGLIGFPGRVRKSRTRKRVGQTCPRCGKTLVQRINGRTKQKFIGCSGFPGCKFSQ